MEIIIEKHLIDCRNSELWNIVNTHFDINIQNSKNNEYSCYTENNFATIYIVPNRISIPYFTHELLHIYLKCKNFYLGNSIGILISEDYYLSKVLSNEVLNHISNCLDHLKMFKIYYELGFNKNDFLLDYNDFKCTSIELRYLKQNFKIDGIINKSLIDFFIGKLISLLCDPNELNDYDYELKEIEKIDKDLYKIVYELVEKVKSYNLEQNHFYNKISFNFKSDLRKWYDVFVNKTI